jgi:hypothetical protein
MTRSLRCNLYHGTRVVLALIAMVGVTLLGCYVVVTPLDESLWVTGPRCFIFGGVVGWIAGTRVLKPMAQDWADARFVATEPLDMEEEAYAFLAEEKFQKALEKAYKCKGPMVFSRKDAQGHIDVWSRYPEEIDAAQRQRQLHRERGFE